MSTSTDLVSTTLVRVACDGERVRVELSSHAPSAAPQVRPMLLASDAAGARVALVPDGALLLADDHVRIVVEVGAGAALELVEPGGTVAYDMDGRSARWDVHATVSEGASLLWHGEPFVVSAGARVRRTTRVVAAEEARVAIREVLVLGRHGEVPGLLEQHTACVRPDGHPVLIEALEVDAARCQAWLGGRPVVASVMTLGLDPQEPASSTVRFDLEEGGHVYRACAGSAHEAADHGLWDQVARAIRSRTSNSMPTASAR
ncbi:urease accessory protein UreD [Nocardioides jejuensis]|nr:urease accessory protein UreD [Nocardioides jejuensis]